MKVGAIVFLLLVFRFLIDLFKLDILPEMTLIAAFVGGTMFILAVIMSGVLADFKESEKIADDLPAAITNIFLCSRLIQSKDDTTTRAMQSHIHSLLSTINSNLKQNEWNRWTIHSQITIIAEDLRLSITNNADMSVIMAIQTELANVMRMLNRIETIVKTTFLPATYIAGYISVGISIVLLLFAQIPSIYEAQAIVGSVSFLLVILILLITDEMENPFEVTEKSLAGVDLSHLFDLERYLGDMEKVSAPSDAAASVTD